MNESTSGDTGLWNDWSDGDVDDFDDGDDGSDLGAGSDPSGNDFSDSPSANDVSWLGELPETFDEDDHAVASTFFSGLEGKVSPEVGQELLSRYEKLVEDSDSKEHGQDLAHADFAKADLKKAWGAENYAANIGELKSALESQPFGENLLDARFPDGRAVFNDAAFAKWLHNLIKGRGANMQQRSPGGPGPTTLQREKASIEAKMGTREYIKNPRMQARYRELLKLLGQAT